MTRTRRLLWLCTSCPGLPFPRVMTHGTWALAKFFCWEGMHYPMFWRFTPSQDTGILVAETTYVDLAMAPHSSFTGSHRSWNRAVSALHYYISEQNALKWSTHSWALSVIYTQRLDQLWVPALTATHCREKLLRPKLRAVRIYGYKQVFTVQFDNMTIWENNCSRFSSRAHNSPAMVFWPGLQYQTRSLPCGSGLVADQKAVAIPQIVMLYYFTSVHIFFQAVWYCSMQDLGKTIDVFLPQRPA